MAKLTTLHKFNIFITHDSGAPEAPDGGVVDDQLVRVLGMRAP